MMNTTNRPKSTCIDPIIMALPKQAKIIFMLCSIGIILSLYALYVEHRLHLKEMGSLDEEFTALCDIEAIGASCSSAFSLPQGKLLSFFSIVPKDHLLDVPNAGIGVVYYTVIMISSKIIYSSSSSSLSTSSLSVLLSLQSVLSILAMSASLFLAYTLVTLREFCILCISTHIINFILLILLNKRRAFKYQKQVKIS